jgi:signal transduction histidine kinase
MTQADFVSIVTPTDADGLIHVLCGYERSTKHFIESSAVEASTLPILNSCLKMGRMRRLAASSSSPDRQTMEKLYDFERVGAMLFVPVLSAEGNPLSGAVIVAEDYEKDWTVEEQEKIGLIVKFLILYLSQAQEMAKIHSDLNLSRRSAIFVQEQAQQVYDEQRKLRDTITVLKEQSLQDKDPTSTISLEVEDQVALQRTIRHLQMDNQRLALAIDQVDAKAAQSRKALEAELKLTLEEISLLRSTLEGGVPTLDKFDQSAARPQPSERQLERLSTLVEDLRRPLASMTGYTELLLDESTTALTGTQHEYLERIRHSTGRFSQLLEELAGEATLEPTANHADRILVDARELIGEALQAVDASFKQRRIDLRIQLPDHELPVLTDPPILRRVILLLLENAAAVTPEGGRAGISAWLEKRETGRGYLFIQVQDQGGGFPLQEIPQLFMSRLEPRPSNETGEGSAGLFRLKTTLEQLGGRIWVESEPDIGLIFSILLPAAFIPEMGSGTEEPA